MAERIVVDICWANPFVCSTHIFCIFISAGEPLNTVFLIAAGEPLNTVFFFCSG